jgi:hypothetical protein
MEEATPLPYKQQLYLIHCADVCLQEGIDKFFEAAQAAKAALEEATPLLEEATALTKEITPLLQVCACVLFAACRWQCAAFCSCGLSLFCICQSQLFASPAPQELCEGGLTINLNNLTLSLVLPHSCAFATLTHLMCMHCKSCVRVG